MDESSKRQALQRILEQQDLQARELRFLLGQDHAAEVAARAACEETRAQLERFAEWSSVLARGGGAAAGRRG